MGYRRHEQRWCTSVKAFITWYIRWFWPFNSSMVLVIAALILVNVSLVNGPFRSLLNWLLANGPIDSVSDDGECAAANDKCDNDVVFQDDVLLGSGDLALKDGGSGDGVVGSNGYALDESDVEEIVSISIVGLAVMLLLYWLILQILRICVELFNNLLFNLFLLLNSLIHVSLLVIILTEHCHRNKVSYKQGMNYVLASLLYAASVCEGYDYIHSLEIIYRNLKHGNLVLDSRGYLKNNDRNMKMECIEISPTTTIPIICIEISFTTKASFMDHTIASTVTFESDALSYFASTTSRSPSKKCFMSYVAVITSRGSQQYKALTVHKTHGGGHKTHGGQERGHKTHVEHGRAYENGYGGKTDMENQIQELLMELVMELVMCVLKVVEQGA